MGYDAYHLVAKLFGPRTGPMDEMDGATGRLYLAADGRIHRRLAWAQFQHGEPVAMPAISQFEIVLQEIGSETDQYSEEEWQEPIPDP
jgi:hypothetical protein